MVDAQKMLLLKELGTLKDSYLIHRYSMEERKAGREGDEG
jgi:hypothetical protein